MLNNIIAEKLSLPCCCNSDNEHYHKQNRTATKKVTVNGKTYLLCDECFVSFQRANENVVLRKVSYQEQRTRIVPLPAPSRVKHHRASDGCHQTSAVERRHDLEKKQLEEEADHLFD